MTQPIVLHDPTLRDRLNELTRKIGQQRMITARMLIENRRIWDYHADAHSVRAMVEAATGTFYQVTIRWHGPSRGCMPSLSADMPVVQCDCDSNAFCCAHAAAVILYRLLELDRQAASRPIAAVAADERDEADFHKLFAAFSRLSHAEKPAFLHFDCGKLHSRSDFSTENQRIAEAVMRQFRAGA
ncbi:MAG: hypothetical protein LKI94_08815 [Sporolactobacillus sp.]|jgi:hypothetical protein|nr:hypothetical protein [Sporolactobacillus sp.]